jgi:hypothetical protein
MKYDDFASLVQLGVGLHVGTAILQLYGEIGIQPLLRSIERTKSLLGAAKHDEGCDESLIKLETDFAIFKIELFNEYKKYIGINSVVAVLLAALLVLISYNAEEPISAEFTVFIVGLSVLPAPITLGVLWFEASRKITPMKTEADALERRALRLNPK